MKILHQFEQPNEKPIVIAAGCFDGVHLGHQAVLGEAIRRAAEVDGEAWVLTFDPHPARVLKPENAPKLLSTQNQQIAEFEKLGIAGVFQIPFTSEFLKIEPADFADLLIEKLPNLVGFVTGDDWRFGKNASGTTNFLRDRWRDISVTSVSQIEANGERVSSTRIRQLISEGDVKTASKLLGRFFSVVGIVEHGRQVGRKLGFPTANIKVENEVEPSPGIYAAFAKLGAEIYQAAAYIGSRKTFSDTNGERVLEVFLLNFDGEIYDETLEIQFVEKIRDDIAFSSVDLLKTQIEKDIAQIRDILKSLTH